MRRGQETEDQNCAGKMDSVAHYLSEVCVQPEVPWSWFQIYLLGEVSSHGLCPMEPTSSPPRTQLHCLPSLWASGHQPAVYLRGALHV